MKVFHRKSQLQRVLETIRDVIDVPGRSKPSRVGGSGRFKVGLPSTGSGHARKVAVPKDKAMRAGLIAGGIASVAAGSAGISSLRRRKEGARSDS